MESLNRFSVRGTLVLNGLNQAKKILADWSREYKTA